jgi:glucose/mannose-6-phosphate isomerase
MEERARINLDDSGVYSRLDPEGMLNHIHNFPGLCRQAWEMGAGFRLPADYARVKKVIILGMGGSAIGGDLAGSLAMADSPAPVLVCREYNLPQYADDQTLVIASSYSGMTEETLSAFEQAFDTPAKKLAITTGGKLKSLAETMNVPVFSFDYQSPPRAAFPFSFFIILGILQKLDLLPERPQEVSEALTNLDTLGQELNEAVPAEQNPAKSLALKMLGRLPIIYGAGITAEIARRWKGQINENSKTMAFFETFSELNHNSVCGYNLPEELVRQSIIIMLDSDLLHERIHLRYEITQKLLEQAGIYYRVVRGKGDSAISQMLTLVLYGDYVSYYLGILNGANPTSIQAIDFLKSRLAEG